MKVVVNALFVLMALAGIARAGDGFGELSIAEVQSKLTLKDVHIYDCNDPSSYKSGHVPGARQLDYPNATEKDFPADKKAMLIFYCMNEH